jgi:2-iminobutanoate/2-iminopropanoate deaminase
VQELTASRVWCEDLAAATSEEAMGAEREVIAGADVPPAFGPYSPGVRAGGFLYVAGQAGIDPETGEPAGSTLVDQARQAMRNLEAVLRAGGSRPDLVVNTTVLVADVGEFAVVNEMFAEMFPVDPPARMTMQVPLPMGLLISIGCVALVEAA